MWHLWPAKGATTHKGFANCRRSIIVDDLDFNKPWWNGISAEAKDFVRMLLDRDVSKRPTAKEALKHPWLQVCSCVCVCCVCVHASGLRHY